MIRPRSGDPAAGPDRAALAAERARLEARLAELNRLLAPVRERAVVLPPEHR